MIRRGAAAVAAAAVVGGTLLLPAPARAAEGCDGVLVVVETRSVPDRPGYGTRTGCAPAPRSGIQALQQAGFAVRLGTGPYAGGFVCALDGAPKAGCGAVTKDRYWSYWYMLPGTDTWVYSAMGAGNRVPPDGSVEGWVWQDGGDNEPPGPRSAKAPAPPAPTPPPAATRPPTGGGPTAPATRPPAVPTTRPPAAATTGPGSPAGGPAPAVPDPAAAEVPPSSATGSATPADPASASAGDGAATGSPETSGPSAAPPSAGRADAAEPAAHRAGAWLPVALGGAAVVALAGAAVRRRRSGRGGPAGDLP
ncbi:hypothetical protein [Kitasatospora sp. NPDC088346]|uniref:hypothetical protein n=1 Tax=Kitasatospora sp. NPDC088346 TaxID=3364073 RepID=UPI0037F81D30